VDVGDHQTQVVGGPLWRHTISKMADGRQFENRTYAITRPRIVRSSPNFARRLRYGRKFKFYVVPRTWSKLANPGKCVLPGQDPKINDCRESPSRKVIIVVHLLFYMQSLHNYAKHGVRHQCRLPVQFAYALGYQWATLQSLLCRRLVLCRQQALSYDS